MRVSVVIPVWNEDPQWLLASVASVQADNAETIIVNDGSTDPKTLAALDQLSRKYTVIEQENAGPAAARNAGIAGGSGDLILLMDSDDIASPGYVDQLRTALTMEPRCPIAYANVKGFGAQTREFEIPEAVTPEMMLHQCHFMAASMFRRWDWERLGGLDENLREGLEDWEWWTRILLDSQAPARLAPAATLHYRLKESSRNVANWNGVSSLKATRQAMLRNNPGHAHLVLQAVLNVDLDTSYTLGQNQSPIAAAASDQARYYARRYGKVEGLISRLERLFRRHPQQAPNPEAATRRTGAE